MVSSLPFTTHRDNAKDINILHEMSIPVLCILEQIRKKYFKTSSIVFTSLPMQLVCIIIISLNI